MNTDLCVGVLATADRLEIATLQRGKAAIFSSFPATEMGIEAIKGYLTGYGRSVRLAVGGVAHLNLALRLGNVAGRETFVVSPACARQALDLALYAEQTA